MKTNILLTAAIGLAAIGAVTIPKQPSLADRLAQINKQISAERESAKAPAPALPPAAVILATDTTYHFVQGPYGGYNTEDGQIVQYATVSSNGPAGLRPGMNAADAIAIITGEGLHIIHNQYGYFIFAR